MKARGTNKIKGDRDAQEAHIDTEIDTFAHTEVP